MIPNLWGWRPGNLHFFNKHPKCFLYTLTCGNCCLTTSFLVANLQISLRSIKLIVIFLQTQLGQTLSPCHSILTSCKNTGMFPLPKWKQNLLNHHTVTLSDFFPPWERPAENMDASQNHLESQTIYYKAPDRKSLNKYIKPFLAGI